MKFRTKLPIKTSDIQIQHTQKLLLIGSCFSNNIGSKLSDSLFDVVQNPFGIIYNPISIFKLLTRALKGDLVEEKELSQNGDLFFHYDFHSDFTDLDKTQVLKNLNASLAETAKYLKQTDVLFITLGTAWVYELAGTIVANCHKMSGKLFVKRMLDLEELIDAITQFKSLLSMQHNNLKIVFTLSPVRHIKDGFEENQVSKSLLRYFIHGTKELYFPSYELLLDDLRDYRFYEQDMLHPNSLAINYIWEYFQEMYFSESTQKVCKEAAELKTALNHRPRNEQSVSHQKFLAQLELKIKEFEQRTSLKIR